MAAAPPKSDRELLEEVAAAVGRHEAILSKIEKLIDRVLEHRMVKMWLRGL